MTDFAADDARLGAMHGYGTGEYCSSCEGIGRHHPGCFVARLEAKVDRLETLVRELTVALRSGAVGKWT